MLVFRTLYAERQVQRRAGRPFCDDEGRMTSLQYPTVSAVGSFGNMAVKMPIAAMEYDVNGRLTGMTTDDQDGRGPQAFASEEGCGEKVGLTPWHPAP
jgi:hypothetical protein